jgi:N-acetylglucosamine kinase-like BadF-type ATPase
VPERILLAIDAGGTRTRCVVASSRGRVLGTGGGGPGNHILDGWDVARQSLATATAAALAAAGSRPEIALASSAGVGPGGEGRDVVESLLGELLPGVETVAAVGDMVAALWGALPTPVGVVVSAGTGSVCFGRAASGATRQVGGWGHLLGDEGSAYDIAVRALRAVARAEDGRAAPTQLRAALTRLAGVASPQELALQLYAGGASRERIASFAAEVAAAAARGDVAARQVLSDAADELALAAVTALRVLDLRQGTVSYAGSVFDAGECVLEPFRARIVRDVPGARIEPPFLSGLGGALRLALRRIEEPEDRAVLQAWRDELRGAGA